jgi:DNA-binding CsgD family transcriptional regulator
MSRVVIGRTAERARIAEVVAAAREGRSAVLLVHGEPGAGKTTLLCDVRDHAAQLTVLRAQGIESEAGLPFAGLHELVRPLLPRLDEIPATQAEALRGALRLAPADELDRFAISAALLSLLVLAAEHDPLLVVVDDAHWLDAASAHAIVFAARRLGADAVCVLVGLRTGSDSPFVRAGFEELRLEGVDEGAGLAIVAAATHRHVHPGVARALTRLTRGNPLALVELQRTLSDLQLAGSEPLPDVLPGTAAIMASFAQRLESLAEEERLGLLVAAASDSTDVEVISRACEHLGADPAHLDAAEVAGLIEVSDMRLSFRHPLVRSAVYGAASAPDRRRAHRALADAFAAGGDHERAAWHRGTGAGRPDERVAQELADAATSARRRSGYKAAASALELAARLTVDPELRARRLLEASVNARRTANVAWALRLANRAAGLARDEALRADIELSRGLTAMLSGDAREAVRIIEAAADAVEATDPVKTATLLSYSSSWSMALGETAPGLASAQRAHRLLLDAGYPEEGMPVTAIESLAGLLLLRGDTDEGRRLLDLSVRHHLEPENVAGSEFPAQCLIWIEGYDRAEQLLDRLATEARHAGDLTTLAQLRESQSTLYLRTGRWQHAYAAAAESLDLSQETELSIQTPYSLAVLAQIEAATGREDACREHAGRALALDRDSGIVLEYAGAALGLLEMGLRRCEAAVEQLLPVEEHVRSGGRVEPAVFFWPADLVEALIHVNRRAEALQALARLEDDAARTGRAWAHAVTARHRGMLARDGDEADEWFAAALRRHEATPTPFERARTELEWGDALRRRGRRVEARKHLHEALAVFERLGAEPWAERTRSCLLATGATRLHTDLQGVAALTGQELQIAMLVTEGATNREVAARLFLSPKTIEAHLSRIYRKLEVHSRVELAGRLAVGDRPPPIRAGRG